MSNKAGEGLHRLKIVEEKLKEREYKLTPQRKATLDVLIEHSSEHLSTEEIYELVKEKQKNVGTCHDI